MPELCQPMSHVYILIAEQAALDFVTMKRKMFAFPAPSKLQCFFVHNHLPNITAYAGSQQSAANCILTIFLVLVRFLVAHTYLLRSFHFTSGIQAEIEAEAAVWQIKIFLTFLLTNRYTAALGEFFLLAQHFNTTPNSQLRRNNLRLSIKACTQCHLRPVISPQPNGLIPKSVRVIHFYIFYPFSDICIQLFISVSRIMRGSAPQREASGKACTE